MTCYANLVIANLQVTLVETADDVYEVRFVDMRDGTTRVVPAKSPGSDDAMKLLAAWLMYDERPDFSLMDQRERLAEAMNGTYCFLP